MSNLIANNSPLKSPLVNIEFTFIAASNILSASVNSKTSVTYGLYSRPSSKLSGQNGEEVHYGTIKVPLALHFTR